MDDGIVFDIKEFAVFDGPGIRTTVFLKGCPLRCRWYHNPEGLSPAPQLMVSAAACVHCGACRAVCPLKEGCIVCGKCVAVCRKGLRKISGQHWTSLSLAERLMKDADVYADTGGGVTFSGGEPLLQWPFVAQVIDRMPGVHTAIETSGYTSDAVFADAMKKCDLVLMDWKVSDPEALLRYTGAEQAPILRHLQMLVQGETPFILRMPIIPDVNDIPLILKRPQSWWLMRPCCSVWNCFPISQLPEQSTKWWGCDMIPGLRKKKRRECILKLLRPWESPICFSADRFIKARCAPDDKGEQKRFPLPPGRMIYQPFGRQIAEQISRITGSHTPRRFELYRELEWHFCVFTVSGVPLGNKMPPGQCFPARYTGLGCVQRPG